MAWSLPAGSVLGIFGNQPGAEAGPSDASLDNGFGPEKASAVREALLFDVLGNWSDGSVLAPGGRRVLVYAPADAGPWFDARVPEAFALQPQSGGDPAERVRAFFAGEFADGASKVVLLDPGAATLDPSIVISAFLCLDGRDVVVGPDSAGGVYLLGCRSEAAPVFDGVEIGVPDALTRVVDRLNATGLTLALLPPWYVVDSPDGFRTLAGHLRALRRAGVKPGLPRLETLAEQMSPRATT